MYQDEILNLDIVDRTSDQCWQIAIKNRGLAVGLARATISNDQDLIDDLIQDGLIGIYHSVANYKPPYMEWTFRRFAAKYCRNAIYKSLSNYQSIKITGSTLRKARLDQVTESPAVSDARHILHLGRISISDIDIEAPSNRRPNTIDVSLLLSSLPPNESQAVRMYFFERALAKDIAPVLNVSPNSVTRSISRLLSRLGKSQQWPTSPPSTLRPSTACQL